MLKGPLLVGLVAVSMVGCGGGPQAAAPAAPGVIKANGSPAPVTSLEQTTAIEHPPPLHLPRLHAPSAILIDLSTGDVLFAHRARTRRPVASLTKIMTALLVLEGNPNLRGTVRVSRRAARQEPIVVGLEAGSRLPVADLMYGLLLWSGNDTAVALAEHVSRSVPAFVRRMNGRASSLGLRNTHFAGPSGLDDRGYSTARDIAVLARVALGNRRFATLVDTRRHRIHGPKHQLHKLRNLNGLLGSYQGAIGVKTGYTRAAGECLVGAARRGDRSVLAVVLGERVVPHWAWAYRDTKRLLGLGFRMLAAPGARAS